MQGTLYNVWACVCVFVCTMLSGFIFQRFQRIALVSRQKVTKGSVLCTFASSFFLLDQYY